VQQHWDREDRIKEHGIMTEVNAEVKAKAALTESEATDACLIFEKKIRNAAAKLAGVLAPAPAHEPGWENMKSISSLLDLRYALREFLRTPPANRAASAALSRVYKKIGQFM
jgi:hypothetical protein